MPPRERSGLSLGQATTRAAPPRKPKKAALLKPGTVELMVEQKIDAWVTYHVPNTSEHDLALDLAHARGVQNMTAPFLLVMYADEDKEPTLLVLPGEKHHYDYFAKRFGRVVTLTNAAEGRDAAIREALTGCNRVAVEHTPDQVFTVSSSIPHSLFHLLTSLGDSAEFVSSTDLIQAQVTILTPVQVESHIRAAELLTQVMKEAFAFIGSRIGRATEYDVQQFILRRLGEVGLETDIEEAAPIVAVGENAAIIHYTPTNEGEGAKRLKTIGEGDLILVDFVGKGKGAEDVFADITWMAYTGSLLPDKYARAFSKVVQARDAAITKIGEMVRAGETLVPSVFCDVARGIVGDAGLQIFIHMLGHSITKKVHGEGPPLGPARATVRGVDLRNLLPGTLFSVEPGTYPDADFGDGTEIWGMRSEVNVYIDPTKGSTVTSEAQKRIYLIQ